uniref:Uncharacterized protein n=1 Tax=Lotus japonicus TaxID=34305 RepID=I3T2Q4_LOTJA|nr:unknown [Lotus japonicus]
MWHFCIMSYFLPLPRKSTRTSIIVKVLSFTASRNMVQC